MGAARQPHAERAATARSAMAAASAPNVNSLVRITRLEVHSNFSIFVVNK